MARSFAELDAFICDIYYWMHVPVFAKVLLYACYEQEAETGVLPLFGYLGFRG